MFYSSLQKFFLFLSCLNFCSKIYGVVVKWQDKKAKIYFKLYDVADW